LSILLLLIFSRDPGLITWYLGSKLDLHAAVILERNASLALWLASFFIQALNTDNS
jgi:hypothetical protein